MSRSPRTRTARRRLLAVPALAAAGLVMAACANDEAPAAGGNVTAPAQQTGGSPIASSIATGALRGPDGQERGNVVVQQPANGSGLEVHVTVNGLPAGFHGLHVHGIGKCEPNSPDPANPGTTGNFLSSGGHLAGDRPDHPDHAGDLPPLLVGQDGTARLVTSTDRLTRELLLDGDGAAVVVHERPDNFANVPTRYASAGADDETKKAGDAGSRVACAVLTAPGDSSPTTS